MCDRSFNQSIKEIKDATVRLNRLYVRLRNAVFFSLLLSTTLVVVLAIKIKLGEYFGFGEISARFIDSQYLFCLIGFFGVAAIIQVRRKIFRPCISKFRTLYVDTLKLCNEIVDTSDWSNLRKRDLTDNKRITVKQTVDEFYKIRERRFFPGKTDKSILHNAIMWSRLLQLIIMSELVLYMGYGLCTELFR